MLKKIKKIICVLLLLAVPSVASAQYSTNEKVLIKAVKLSGEYIYGEATLPTYEEAFDTALTLFKAKIENELMVRYEMPKTDRAPIVEKVATLVTIVSVKRENMERIFVFISKDNILGDKETPDDIVEQILKTNMVKAPAETPTDSTLLLVKDTLQQLDSLDKAKMKEELMAEIRAEEADRLAKEEKEKEEQLKQEEEQLKQEEAIKAELLAEQQAEQQAKKEAEEEKQAIIATAVMEAKEQVKAELEEEAREAEEQAKRDAEVDAKIFIDRTKISRLEPTLREIASQETYDDIIRKLKSLKDSRRVVYGKLKSSQDNSNSYIIVFENASSDKRVIAILGKGSSLRNRDNLLKDTTPEITNQHGFIWFQLTK